MAKRCYYQSLEVDRAASDGDIKAAFRKQAMQWFESAMNKLNSKTPVFWKWREMVARELLNFAKLKSRNDADRKADFEEAMKQADLALQAAPGSQVSKLEQLKAEIRSARN